MKTKGGALLFAIFLILISSILCSMVIIRAYYLNRVFLSSVLTDRIKLNNQSLDVLLSSKLHLLPRNTTSPIDIFNDGKDIVNVEVKNWGVYDLVISTQTVNHIRSTQLALYGQTGDLPALYITDNNNLLGIGGSTYIKGKCLVPKAVIQKKALAGQGIKSVELYADVSKSSSDLPLIDLNRIKSMYASISLTSENDSIISPEMLNQLDTLSQSFTHSTVRVYSPDKISIEHLFLQGNVIISSDIEITVSSNTYLNNVILTAPSVKIKDAKGCCQIIASNKIELQQGCQLEYPSIAIVYDTLQKSDGEIVVDKNAYFFGSLFHICKSANTASGVKLTKMSSIAGLVYATNYTQCEGQIIGSLISGKTLANISGSLSENMLVNCTIDKSKLPPEFGYPILFNNFTKRIKMLCVK